MSDEQAAQPFDEYAPELVAIAEQVEQRYAQARRRSGPTSIHSLLPDPERMAQNAARVAQRQAEYATTRAQRIDQARAHLESWLVGAGVPKRYRSVAWNMDALPPAVRTWSEAFPAADGGAILAGTYGTGKTCTAVWLLREFYLRSIGTDPEWGYRGPAAKLVHCSDLYDLVFAKANAHLVSMRTTPLLVIDDLGVGYEHDWPLAAMDRLIDVRYGEERPTIVTTNLYPTREMARANQRPDSDSFEGRYPRAYSRLRDACGPGLVLMVGKDMRRPATVRSVR